MSKLYSGDRVIAAIVSVITLIYIYFKCQLGIEFTDGGAYLSSANRILQGDLPFKDEIMFLYKSSDFILYHLFYIFPDLNLLELRLFNFFQSLFCHSILGYYLIRRNNSWSIVFFVGLISILFNNYVGILEPGYNSMAHQYLLASCGLWLFAENSNSNLFYLAASGSGFFLGLASLCYYSLFIMSILMILYILLGSFKKKFLFLGMFSLGLLTPIVYLLGYMYVNDLFNIWYERHQLFQISTLNSLNSTNISGKFLIYFFNIFPYSYTTLLFLPFLKIFPKFQKWILSSGLIWLTFLSLLNLKTSFPNTIFVCLAFSVGARLIMEPLRKETLSVGIWTLASGVFLYSTYFFTAFRSFQSAALGISALLMVTLTFLYRRAPWPTSFLLLGLVLGGGFQHYNTVFRDSAPKKLTASYSHPKLKGIKSTSERVIIVEELLEYLNSIIKPGDYLLAYDDLALLYYLTDTRPSYGFSRTVRWGFHNNILEHLFEKMINNDRLPDYVVKTNVASSDSSWLSADKLDYSDYKLHDFIEKNYAKVKNIEPFIILKKKDLGNK